tara:strand:- start:256 stop:426 length:171 start_codon:yes stop_codon:yes gene_type:complete
MTIEVKQLVIKSRVADGEDIYEKHSTLDVDLKSFKKELLAECKQIISESLQSGRER